MVTCLHVSNYRVRCNTCVINHVIGEYNCLNALNV